MKRTIRYTLVSSFFFLMIISVDAKTISNKNLFPVSTGVVGKVQGNNVNLRQYPDKKATSSGKITEGEVRVLGQNKDWYNVKTGSGEGWVYKDYINVNNSYLIPYTKVKGEEIVDYGMQFMGTPYVWGGSNLLKGVDCSGFTQEVYKAFGINISRVSYMQAKDGQSIEKNHLRAGDLVFFDTVGSNNGGISHVGIYVDDNKFLHSDGTNGVMISNLNSSYYSRKYVKSVRVLQ